MRDVSKFVAGRTDHFAVPRYALDYIGGRFDKFLRNAVDPLDVVVALAHDERFGFFRAVRISDSQNGLTAGVSPQTEYKDTVCPDRNLVGAEPDLGAGHCLTDNETSLSHVAGQLG